MIDLLKQNLQKWRRFVRIEQLWTDLERTGKYQTEMERLDQKELDGLDRFGEQWKRLNRSEKDFTALNFDRNTNNQLIKRKWHYINTATKVAYRRLRAA